MTRRLSTGAALILLAGGVAPMAPIATPMALAAPAEVLPFDFDGDGYADLAIGVPGENVGRRVDAGVVQVIPGSPVGPTAAGDQMWHQNRRGVRGVAERGDRFGSALASGDFNDDGYADLAVGIPGESIGYRRAGAVQVLYGSSRGLTAAGDQIWHQNTPGVPGGNENGDQFGATLAVADFDRDGYADLAVGSPGESIGRVPAGGQVIVLFGSPWGLTAARSQLWNQNSAGIDDWPEAGDTFASALAACDVNNDGHGDLAIAVARESVPNSIGTTYGAVHVLLGSGNGLTAVGSQLVAGLLAERAPFAQPGALACGDFNADGLDDLAVGATDGMRKGVVLVLPAAPGGFTIPVDHRPSAGWWTITPDGGLPTQSTRDDDLGTALAAGDLTGDGVADLVIGAPGYDRAELNRADVGTFYVLAGSTTGMTLIDARWTQQPQSGDRFGSSLAVLPLGAGKGSWLAVGAPGYRVGTRARAGSVVVYAPTATDPGAPPEIGWTWHQDTAGIKGRAESYDGFGAVLGR